MLLFGSISAHHSITPTIHYSTLSPHSFITPFLQQPTLRPHCVITPPLHSSSAFVRIDNQRRADFAHVIEQEFEPCVIEGASRQRNKTVPAAAQRPCEGLANISSCA